MNWDQVAGQWKQWKAHAKSKWSKLTDDDLQNVAAKKDALIGKLQERYGIFKDEAEKQVDEWLHHLSSKHESPYDSHRMDTPRNDAPPSQR